eukprot:3055110-Lingulodinium_polyedra.AAC.1
MVIAPHIGSKGGGDAVLNIPECQAFAIAGCVPFAVGVAVVEAAKDAGFALDFRNAQFRDAFVARFQLSPFARPLSGWDDDD